MSEYIEIETELTDDPAVMICRTNLRLSEEGVESYDSVDAMEEGSPLAQSLAVVDGIVQIEVDGHDLRIWRDLAVPWHVIVADVSSALKEFFL